MRKLKNFFNKKRYFWVISGGVLLLVIFFFWRFWLKKEKKTEYQTQKVERGMIVSSISTSGKIVSTNMVEVVTQASGIVEKVYVKNGDRVNKGDKIVKIALDFLGQQKNTSAWSSYLSARNSLETAKANLYTLQAEMFAKWDSFKTLAESDIYKDVNSANRNLPEFLIAKNEWLAAEAKYKNQQAVVSQAEAVVNNAWLNYQLTSPVVVAPTAGTINGLAVVEGMVIGNIGSENNTTFSSYKIAVVQNEGKIIGSFNLSEIDIIKVEPGQKATITLDSFPDKTYSGEVVTVDKIGTTNNGVTQYPVFIKFDTQTPEILPSMAATAKIIVAKKDNVLLLPLSAVQTQNNQSLVEVLENRKIKTKIVETGIASDTQIEIVSGLDEGEEVVLGTVSSLSSQSRGISPFGGSGMIRMMR